jgi:tetratricopeptide (TPR) repeat protein
MTRFKRWESVVSLLAPVVERLSTPHRSDGHFRLALAYRHLKRFDEAVSSLRVCQTAPPAPLSRTDIVLELSHVHFLQGNLAAAITVFDRGPNCPPALLQQQAFLCLISDDAGKIDIARQMVFNLGTSGNCVNLLYLRGRLAYKRDSLIEAWAAFGKALLLDPESRLVWCALGNVYVRLGQLKDAAHCYTRAITFDNDMLEAWMNYAAVIELSPELRTEMEPFEAQFPERPMLTVFANGSDRFPVIVEPKDRDRFPSSVLLIEQGYMIEVPALPVEVVDDEAVVVQDPEMEEDSIQQPQGEEKEENDEYDVPESERYVVEEEDEDPNPEDESDE